MQPRAAARSSRTFGSLITIAITVALLTLLYRSIGLRSVAAAFHGASIGWLILSVGAIIPITVLRAIRFYWVAPDGALPGVVEALRLTLAASALNVVMPAKSGDLLKSYVIATRTDTPAGVALSIVVYERLLDVAALCFWCLIGWVFGRPDVPGLARTFWLLILALGVVSAVLVTWDGPVVVMRAIAARMLPSKFRQRVLTLMDGWPALLAATRTKRSSVVALSVVLWLSHLLQVWSFTIALNARVPVLACLSVSAIALMAGQLPVTVSGVGTRDLALLFLLGRYIDRGTIAALGLLTATRNFLPPLLGMPFTKAYAEMAVEAARRIGGRRADA